MIKYLFGNQSLCRPDDISYRSVISAVADVYPEHAKEYFLRGVSERKLQFVHEVLGSVGYVDLHGYPSRVARVAAEYAISKAQNEGWIEIVFVVGRGTHSTHSSGASSGEKRSVAQSEGRSVDGDRSSGASSGEKRSVVQSEGRSVDGGAGGDGGDGVAQSEGRSDGCEGERGSSVVDFPLLKETVKFLESEG